jgi:peptidyl-prolyl cis-trans isomerase B (cyclophilin B)
MIEVPNRARAARAAVRACTALLAAAVALGFALGGASANEEKKMDSTPAGAKTAGTKEVAVVRTNMGTIVFEFLPDVAPKMVANFKALAKSGFYDGTTFHRVIAGFMIQGGDPASKKGGSGQRTPNMPAEFTTKYHHVRGMVSTARLGNDINSGSSQFFIMHKDNLGLDNEYTIFGRVIEGMDTVDKIATTPTGPGDRPVKDVVMEKVTIETR